MATSIQLSKEIIEKLDRIAKKTIRSRSQVIRLAIKEFIEKDGN